MRRRSIWHWAASVAIAPATIAAQAVTEASGAAGAARTDTYRSAVAGWIALATPPGYERRATDVIQQHYPGWTRDLLGNLTLRRGSGSPRRVVACDLDDPGFVVTEITDDGYLRLHTAGSGVRISPPWAQFHEGQRIRVTTDRGPVAGVAVVQSSHLNARTADSAIVGVDQLWVDVGAESRAQVLALGVRMLDPVSREWPPWQYGSDLVAGPRAAQRAGCAAVAEASRAAPASGETIYLLSAHGGFNRTGLGAALLTLGAIDTLVLMDADLARRDTSTTKAVLSFAPPPLTALPRPVRPGAVIALGVRSMHAGTLVESVREPDLAELYARVDAAAGNRGGAARAPVSFTAEALAPPRAYPVADSLARSALLLGHLANIYGVSGHESAVRSAVRAALPEWARRIAMVDTAGNLIVAFGPDRDTVVFVAHMDEVGFEVRSIAADGTVTLQARGGGFRSLWEGQPALLHLDRDTAPPANVAGVAGCAAYAESSIRGIFVPRSSWAGKQPTVLTAWFGVDSATLVARGAAIGSSVTAYKCASRIGRTKFTARGLDDRAGSTAQLLALRALDPARVPSRVIFAWVTREETGLIGAGVLAAELGPTVRRVHAIDTFVSSDSPRESSRYAHLPLGAGAVIRAMDGSSVAPPHEVRRIETVARRFRIPLQVGTTSGGNDGSRLARFGAPNIPLSWPGRYSHSPVEVMDLRDLSSLSRLISALARAPAGPRD